MAHGAAMALHRGLPPEVTLYLSASVMEEDCDGYCLLHLIEKEGIRPDVVVIGEPTDLGVYRGQRGRVEATISTRGVSAHAAHPEQGENALYKMAPILLDIEELNERLPEDDFLGKGTIVASHLECTSASLNAVPAAARLFLDRRLTAGETPEGALSEIRALPQIGNAEVELLEYDEVSWRGERARQEKFFPSWVMPEDHPLVQGMAEAVAAVTGEPPRISRWSFSTNGVATMGRHGIPTVGFAPGREELAHTTEEHVRVEDLVTATAAFSLVPAALADRKDDLCKTNS
jgi:putative selenium metabolism hydrolase